ncbi:MAG TPA: NAD(P)-binding domain-containing protein, partial [Woeseiaceae bacterium]|nr:NAD(P)-binding domain-containing protein [Woeseiaceae bacterium]
MSDVSVIGLGAMGSAIAAALLNGGFEVTVWNRTAAKAAPLARLGARAATAPAAAVANSPLTIVCVDDYAATREVLDTAAVIAALGERAIVQFSTGTPDDAREGERWARRHGAEWLDGAILAYPREIGESALVFISGDAAPFERHRPVLSALTTELRYLGTAIGAASA